MKTNLFVRFGALLLAGATFDGAADIIQPQKNRVSTAGLYVPVPLDAHARDQVDASLPAEDITVRNIPYDLEQKAGANHVFVKLAQWPDWNEDPSSYYAAY